MNSSITETPHKKFKLNTAQAMATTLMSFDTLDFVDFDIEVDGKIFSGHSFILHLFSDFFRSLSTSNLKEKQDKMVRLSNVSATTFQLILETLYIRGNTLTADNIIDMWHAVHKLQIAVLIEYCENYILAHVSIDSLETYKKHAEHLNSRRVHAGILKFFMLNFSALRETELFLRLDLEDVIQVIESDELVVGSEDLVLYSVYAWVNYGDVLSAKATSGSVANQDTENDRKIHLAQLLQCTRYCLATECCMLKLHQHKLTLNDTNAKDILNKASSFKLSNTRRYWPNAAIHRDCMEKEHVVAYWNRRTCKLKCNLLKSMLPYNIPHEFTKKRGMLAVLGDCLYIYFCKAHQVEVFKLENNIWNHVLLFNIGYGEKCFFCLSHEDCIYLFTYKKVCRLNTSDQIISCTEDSHSLVLPKHAISFHGNILVFGSSRNGSKVKKTAVHYLNTRTNVWTQLDNITFSSKDMASFEDDTDTYILDCGGNLWKLTDSETVGFLFVAKLWDLKLRLKGALLYRQTLNVYVDNVTTTDGVNLDIGQANLVFSKLKFYGTGFGSSNLVQYDVDLSK